MFGPQLSDLIAHWTAMDETRGLQETVKALDTALHRKCEELEQVRAQLRACEASRDEYERLYWERDMHAGELMDETIRLMAERDKATGGTFPALVAAELAAARAEHPPVPSLHHYHSVLLEELNEFSAEVAKKPRHRCGARLLSELSHIGAMAQRCAEDLGLIPEAA